jgi:uncharacterized protein YjbJ (UPF0337 family)
MIGRHLGWAHYFSALPGDAAIIINPNVYLMTMNKDEIEGKGKQIKGQIREEVGKLTGNKTEQLKGKIEQVEGDVQEGVGKIKRKLEG